MKRMTLIGAVALGVTLVWACSSAVEDLILTPDASAGDSVSTSGERLQIRPIVYEGDDGSVIRMGEEIFDTELGVVCEPGLAADGVLRCLPTEAQEAPSGVAESYLRGLSFADPNCTVPFYGGNAGVLGDCEYHKITAYSDESCGGPRATVRVLALEPHTSVVYEIVEELGGCVAVTDEPLDSWIFREVTSDFASLSRTE